MQPQIQFWPWADCWRQGKPLRLPHAAQTAWVPQRWLFQNEGVLPQDTRCWHNPRQAIAPRNLNGDWPSQAGQSPDAPALRKRGREGKACPHYVVTPKTLLEGLQFGFAIAFHPLSSREPRIGVFEFGFLAESLLEVKNCGPYLALQAFINAQEELSARKMWVQ